MGSMANLYFSIFGLNIDTETFMHILIMVWGAKSQILSSVAPHRKKNLVTLFSQGHVLGPRNPRFSKFPVVNYL